MESDKFEHLSLFFKKKYQKNEKTSIYLTINTLRINLI